MIKARFNRVLFSKMDSPDDNGYRVYRYTVIEGDEIVDVGDTFVAAGNFLPAAATPVYELEGKWINGKMGKQYAVNLFKELINSDDPEEVISYLSEILLFTKSEAQKVIERFGNSSLNILDSNPKKLLDIKGIQIVKLLNAVTLYEKNRCFAALASKLSSYGIKEEQLKRFFDAEGKAASIKVLNANPYILCEYGVPLQTCEQIAKSMSIGSNHTGLCKALMLNVLRSNESSGHTAMRVEKFTDTVRKEMEKRGSIFNLHLAFEELKSSGKLFYVGKYIYARDAFLAENEIARAVAELLLQKQPAPKINIDAEIAKREKKYGIQLHANQKAAIRAIITQSVTVITGGPGTGKTATLKIACDILEETMKKTVALTAPTGRAAARMFESTGRKAKTLHKMLHINDDTLFQQHGSMVKEDVCIVDESSMLDIYVARKLFDAIKPGHRLVLVGDRNQLPSVGTGSVLKDLIECGVVPTVALTKVYRQASSCSLIYLNCQKIINGNPYLDQGDDFRIVEANGFEDSAEKMLQLYLAEVKTYGIDEVCCLSPYRKSTASGTLELNKRLQQAINPANQGKPEMNYKGTVYRLGDRVMNRRNTEDACNGDIGYITSINRSIGRVNVKFAEAELSYRYDELQYLDLAYAMSIHKSQGSEFKCVITNLLPEHGTMLQFNLLNTAVSRAKKEFILVGNTEAIEKAVSNKDALDRISGLPRKLQFCVKAS